MYKSKTCYYYTFLLEHNKKVYKVSKQCQQFWWRYEIIKFWCPVELFYDYISLSIEPMSSNFSQFISLRKAYLLVQFYDDRRSRTCWTKSPSFEIDLILEMALSPRLWCYNSITQWRLHIRLCTLVDRIIKHTLGEY